jgi:putative phosphotransacetylase
MKKIIKVETSARHVHLSEKDLCLLFGEGHKLTFKRELSQPNQYLSEERVKIVGAKSEMDRVAILGPTRPATQVELSLTDARILGVEAPVRESGDVANSGSIKIVGPMGEIVITDGVIIAKRHIHITPEDAEIFEIHNKQIVKVKILGDRALIFDETVVRVSAAFKTAMHIDIDETNAAGINGIVDGEIVE